MKEPHWEPSTDPYSVVDLPIVAARDIVQMIDRLRKAAPQVPLDDVDEAILLGLRVMVELWENKIKDRIKEGL